MCVIFHACIYVYCMYMYINICIYIYNMLEQVGERRNKLSTLVRFPLTGLDMAPHVVKRSQSMKNLNLAAWTPSWKQPSGKHHQPADLILPHDYLYDLYAVCNHHGGMHGGHYTGKELGGIIDCLVQFNSVKGSNTLLLAEWLTAR